jgi:hypothetical protein
VRDQIGCITHTNFPIESSMPADFLQAVHVMLSVAAKAAKMFSKHVIEFPAGICRRYSTFFHSQIPQMESPS